MCTCHQRVTTASCGSSDLQKQQKKVSFTEWWFTHVFRRHRLPVWPLPTFCQQDVVNNLQLGDGGVQDRKQFALKIAKDLFQVINMDVSHGRFIIAVKQPNRATIFLWRSWLECVAVVLRVNERVQVRLPWV